MLPLLILLACKDRAPADTAPLPPLDEATLSQLSMRDIQAEVNLLAGDDFQGRTPGSNGHLMAREHLTQRMLDIGLEPVGEELAVPFPLALDRDRFTIDSSGAVVPVNSDTGWNLVGKIPGTVRPEEHIVLVAHYDHLGVNEEGDAYNGAFDDITAVAALLELAELFVDRPPERSLVFVLTDSEEGGLLGSEAWVEDPLASLDQVVLTISVDPMGRPILPDWAPVVLLGLERSPTLNARWRALAAFSEEPVGFINRSPIVIFGSDQDSFWAVGSPAIWFTSPGMSYYHTVNDTADTIDYRSVKAHLRFLAQAVATLGDETERFTDEGAKPLSVQDAADAAAMAEGALSSSWLTDEERAHGRSLQSDFENAVADGEVEPELGGTFVEAAFFLIFELTTAHPGPTPPPFPEGE